MVTTRKMQDARFTRADYMRLPEGIRAEMIDGVLVKQPSPTGWHQGLVGCLHLELAACVGRRRVVMSPVDFFVAEYNVLQPDLAVLPEDAPIGPDTTEIPTPVLVVEVLSPSTARRDRREKTRIYIRAGVREVWLVDPDTRTVDIVTARGTESFVEGTRPGSGVVPGFAPDLRELFS